MVTRKGRTEPKKALTWHLKARFCGPFAAALPIAATCASSAEVAAETCRCWLSITWSACCSVLYCVAVCYSVLQCVAACCSVLQCAVVCCSVSFRDLPSLARHYLTSMLQYVAVCCSMLQSVAECCRVVQCWLQRLAIIGSQSPDQYVAGCYSVLQRVAVCCCGLLCIAVYCCVLQCVAVWASETCRRWLSIIRFILLKGRSTLVLYAVIFQTTEATPLCLVSLVSNNISRHA